MLCFVTPFVARNNNEKPNVFIFYPLLTSVLTKTRRGQSKSTIRKFLRNEVLGLLVLGEWGLPPFISKESECAGVVFNFESGKRPLVS